MQYDETCFRIFSGTSGTASAGASGRDNGRGRGIFRGLHGGRLYDLKM